MGGQAGAEAVQAEARGKVISVLEVLVLARDFGDLADVSRHLRRWESLGIGGVLIPDHLFWTSGQDQGLTSSPDPVVVLAAIGALSPSLRIGTLVANAGLLHPALVWRHFAQLSALYGGDRVVAGLGAGWNAPEFEALGLAMPAHADRMARLEYALQLGHTLFDRAAAVRSAAAGSAAAVTAGQVPIAPPSSVRPRFLVGGGSNQFLQLAGRLADWADLNGSSRRVPIGRTEPIISDRRRRLLTTTADLAESARVLTQSAQAAGREPAGIRRSVLIDTIEFGTAAESAELRQRLMQAELPPDQPLDDCPYVLCGTASRMRELLAERREKIGLSAIIVRDSDVLGSFMAEVATALG